MIVSSQWQEYQAALAHLDSLRTAFASRSPEQSDLPAIEEGLRRLYAFRRAALVRRWHANLGAAVQAVRVADLDGDGEPEILAVTARQRVFCFRYEKELGWGVAAECSFPERLRGPVVGIAVEERRFGRGQVASILIHDGQRDRVFELLFPDNQGGGSLREIPGSEEDLQPALARGYGDFRHLPEVRLVLPSNQKHLYQVQVQGLYTQEGYQDAGFSSDWRVFAVAYDQHDIFLSRGEEHLRKLPLQVHDGQLAEDQEWGKAARLHGYARAICLYQPPEGSSLIVAATDERQIAAFDTETGEERWCFGVSHDLLTLDAVPRYGQLVVGRQDGVLEVYAVVGREPATPCAKGLGDVYAWAVTTLGKEETVWQHWLQYQQPDLVAFSLERMLQLAPPSGDTLDRLNNCLFGSTPCPDRQAVILRLMSVLEDHLLNQPSGDWTLPILGLLCSLHKQCLRPVRRRISLLIARCATRLPLDARESAEYRYLSEQRRIGDLDEARALFRHGLANKLAAPVQQSLAICGEVLTTRRQVRWVFAADGAITALQPLPAGVAEGPGAVVGTRNGYLYHLNLVDKPMCSASQEGAGEAVRAIALADIREDKLPELTVATASGRVCTYALENGLDFDNPVDCFETDREIWSTALAPKSQGSAQRGQALIGAGVLAHYQYDETEGRWTPLPVDAGESGMSIRVVAVGDVDGDGQVDILLGDADDASLYIIRDVAGERERIQLRLSAAVTAARIVEPGPSAKETVQIVIACVDGFVCLYNHEGQREWCYGLGQAPGAMELFDVDGDGRLEILIGADDGRVYVLDQEGNPLWSILIEAPVVQLAGISLSRGRPHLLIADAEQSLHLLEIITPGNCAGSRVPALTRRCLSFLARDCNLLELLADWARTPPDPYLAGYALQLLVDLADGESDAAQEALRLLAELQPPTDIAVPVRQVYMRTLTKAYLALGADGRDEALLKRLIESMPAGENGSETWQAVLGQLGESGALRDGGLAGLAGLLQVAARHPSSKVRWGTVRLLRPLFHSTVWPNDDSPAWSVLCSTVQGGSRDDDWVLSEIACLVRDCLRDDPARGILLGYHLVRHHVDPRVFAALCSPEKTLLLDEPSVTFFCALNRFLTTDIEQAQAAFAELVSGLREMAAARVVDDQSPLVQLHEGLQTLSGLDDFDALKTVFLSPIAHDTLETLPAAAEELGVLGKWLLDLLKEMGGLMQRHLQRHESAPFQERWEALDQLAGDLEALRNRLVHGGQRGERDDGLATLWSKLFAAIIAHWASRQGPVGHKIADLTRFRHRLEAHRIRIRGGTIQFDTRLINVGNQPARELSLGHPRVYWTDQELDCDVDPGFGARRSTLGSGEQIANRIQVAPPTPLLESRMQSGIPPSLDVYIPLRYFQPPDSWLEEQAHCRVDLPRQALRLSRYSDSFPTSWQHYGPQLTKLLSGSAEFALVECERSLRRSLLEDAVAQLPTERTIPMGDLATWYHGAIRMGASADGTLLQLQAWRLHEWLLKVIWPEVESGLLAHLRAGGADEETFRQAVRMGPGIERPCVVVLDNFDYVLLQLLRQKETATMLEQSLDLWIALAKEGVLRFVLGGSYLVEKILETRYPEVHRRMTVMRPEYLKIDGESGKRELVGFIATELVNRGLTDTLSWFSPALTPEVIVELSGGNLTFLNALVLPGLDAIKHRAKADGRPPSAQDPLRYFVAYGRETNFYTMVWMWLDFFEKLALTVVAHSDVKLESESWATEKLAGLLLSHDYYSRQPSGEREKMVLRAGTSLTPTMLMSQIRSNRYYRSGDVRVEGFSLRRPSSLEEQPETCLLVRLIDVAGKKAMMDKLQGEAVLAGRRAGQLGELYHFRLPLYRAWFQQNQVLECLVSAIHGSSAAWYPDHFPFDEQLAVPGQQRYLFEERPFKPVYQEIPLTSLPAVDAALRTEDYPGFFNLYGVGRQEIEPRARWRGLVAFARLLSSFLADPDGVSRVDVDTLFSNLGKLIKCEAPELTGTLAGPAIRRLDGAASNFIWQYFEFTDIFAGFRKSILLGIVPDGRSVADQVPDLMAWVRQQMRAVLKDEIRETEALNIDALLSRSVAILFAPHQHDVVAERMRQLPSQVRYVILGQEELAQVLVDSQPAERLLRLCQNKIGRHSLSPYKLIGSLPGDSRLFVGRQEEITRILEHIESQDFIILGSRTIGKTSLLRRIQHRLEETGQHYVFQINLQGQDTVAGFYERLKVELERLGLQRYRELLGPGQAPYEDLHRMMQRLYTEQGRPAILLVDEVDGLYHHDREESRARFFWFLRNSLAQSQPRLCAFVMTGYRTILLDRQDHTSVFQNFGEFMNIGGVDPESARQLIGFLDGYGITFYNRSSAEARLLSGTYCIPVLLQEACDRLLALLDRHKTERVESDDVRAVLTRDVLDKLKKQLLDDIKVEYDEEGVSPTCLQLRMRITLLSAVLGKYAFKEQVEAAYDRLRHEERSFTARDVVGYLDEWAKDLREQWLWSEEEVDRLLRSLTLTMALSPEEDRPAYYFPAEILPDVLFRLQEENPEYHIIDRLTEQIEQYKKSCPGERS